MENTSFVVDSAPKRYAIGRHTRSEEEYMPRRSSHTYSDGDIVLMGSFPLATSPPRMPRRPWQGRKRLVDGQPRPSSDSRRSWKWQTPGGRRPRGN